MDTKLLFYVIPCASLKFPPAPRYFYNDLHMETWMEEVGVSAKDTKIKKVTVMIPTPLYMIDASGQLLNETPSFCYLANPAFSLEDEFKRTFEPWTRRFDSESSSEEVAAQNDSDLESLNSHQFFDYRDFYPNQTSQHSSEEEDEKEDEEASSSSVTSSICIEFRNDDDDDENEDQEGPSHYPYDEVEGMFYISSESHGGLYNVYH